MTRRLFATVVMMVVMVVLSFTSKAPAPPPPPPGYYYVVGSLLNQFNAPVDGDWVVYSVLLQHSDGSWGHYEDNEDISHGGGSWGRVIETDTRNYTAIRVEVYDVQNGIGQSLQVTTWGEGEQDHVPFASSSDAQNSPCVVSSTVVVTGGA